MGNSEGFGRYERQAQVLERIAKNYRAKSKEVAVLKEAAFALAFALTQRYEEFRHYLAEVNRPLTEREEERLKKLGLNMRSS